MFSGKKTDEAEWSRFSKALSGREEADASSDAEGAPTVAGSVSARSEGTSSQLLTRPASGEASAGSRGRSLGAEVDDIESTIGEHTTVDGSFKSENSIRVRGIVQGEIESRRSILIEEQANVTAKVTAVSVTVAGKINGQIHCVGRVEIKPSGRVTGEINAGTLIMQEGAFFEGQLKMGSTADVASGSPSAKS